MFSNTQKLAETQFQRLGIFDLAFPDDQYLPALSGVVFFPRIRDMQLRRWAGVMVSMRIRIVGFRMRCHYHCHDLENDL